MNSQGEGWNRKGIIKLGLVMVAILVVSGCLLLIVFPAINEMREKARRIQCLANLHAIWREISAYGLEPADVGLTNWDAKLPPDVFVCPAAGRLCKTKPDTNCYYQYNSWLMDTDGGKILLCDMNGPNQLAGPNAWGGNHGGKGGNVVKVSGVGQWMVMSNYPLPGCLTNPALTDSQATNDIRAIPLKKGVKVNGRP